MAWLVRDHEVLATLEIADTGRSRARGLLGRDDFDGALLIRPARSVHTFGMRFAIDVAFVDKDLRVIRMSSMARRRLSPLVWKAAGVIEARAGTFGSWELKVGDQLEVKG